MTGGCGHGGTRDAGHRVHRHILPPPCPAQAPRYHIRLVQYQIRLQIISQKVLL